MAGMISFSIIDGAGKNTSLPLYYSGTPTDAQIQTFTNEFAAALDAVIGGKLLGVSSTKEMALPAGLKANAVASSERQRGALLSFDPANTTRGWSYFIPTWDTAGFSGDAVLDTGAYGTFQDLIVNGDTAGTLELTDPYYNDLVAYLSGKKTFRK